MKRTLFCLAAGLLVSVPGALTAQSERDDVHLRNDSR
jgi:hypothetical protein